MNLPVCIFAFLLLAVSLRDVTLGHAKDASWKNFIKKFDFFGLYDMVFTFLRHAHITLYSLLFMLGTSLLVIGFSTAMSNGCRCCRYSTQHFTHHHAVKSPSTLLLVTLGPVILACGGFYEVHTTREALFPPAVFKSLTVGKKLASRGKLFYISNESFSDHSNCHIPSQFRIHFRHILPCTLLPSKVVSCLVGESNSDLMIGCEWYDPTASWYTDVAIFTRIIIGFGASRLVYFILPEA
jgi:hypothetical protein